ncbi:MAG TPA: hypothetical protein VE988_01095 [Gemmataceae bacterium]|nr:hypothetical protein [Gemmataceae bacterium]
MSDSIGKIQAHCLCGKAKVVTVGLNSGIVEIWDLNTGKHLSNLVRHDGFIDCLALSPDGHTLASGSSDTTILLWDLRAATAQKEKAKGKGFSLVP